MANCHDKPLLILDIDETLVHATERQLGLRHDFLVGPYFVYKRPHLDRFLSDAAQLFRLAVWSSSSDGYIANVVGHILLGDLTLEFQWSRTQCVYRLDPEKREDVWLKDLRKVKRRGYDLDRVLIVDDEPAKLTRNYGNAIYVAPFEGNPNDSELPLLLKYLEGLCHTPNFRAIEKRGWRSQVMAQGNSGTVEQQHSVNSRPANG